MTQHQPSKNPDSTKPTTSNKSADIDLAKASNLVATAIINAANSTTQPPSSKKPTMKERVEVWISILQLIVIIGVQIVFAWYIHNQDQGLQNQLTKQNQDFQLQLAKQNQDFQLRFEEIQREANQARLQISFTHGSSVNIRNIGQVTANNVVMTITIIYVYSAWKNIITDIRQFNFDTSDNSALDSKNPTNIPIPDVQAVAGMNAEKMTLKTLAPGENITINVSLGASVKTQPYTLSHNTNIEVTFSSPTGTSPEYLGASLLPQYFDEVFGITTFDINTSCSNCLVDDKTPNEVLLPLTAYDVGLFGDINIQQTKDGKWKTSATAMGTYLIPLGASVNFTGSSICLTASQISSNAIDNNTFLPLTYVNFHRAFPTFVWPNLVFFPRSCNT